MKKGKQQGDGLTALQVFAAWLALGKDKKEKELLEIHQSHQAFIICRIEKPPKAKNKKVK